MLYYQHHEQQQPCSSEYNIIIRAIADSQIHKWTRLVLFHAVEHSVPVLLSGEPIDLDLDVGQALASQPPKEVKVRVWSMANPEDAHAEPTDEILTVKTVFSPLNSSRKGSASAASKNPVKEQDETIKVSPSSASHPSPS